MTYNIDGHVLPFTDHIRDLGVYHDSRLKYDEHISNIVHNAFSRSVLILKCFHSHDYRLLKLAFTTYVRPLLEFSSRVWSPHYKYLIDKLESMQRFCTRKLSGLNELSYFLLHLVLVSNVVIILNLPNKRVVLMSIELSTHGIVYLTLYSLHHIASCKQNQV